MKFNLYFLGSKNMFYILDSLILIFACNSSERDEIVYVAQDIQEHFLNLDITATKTDCFCRIKRDVRDKTIEIEHIKYLLASINNIKYQKYIIEDIEIFGLKFDIFQNLNAEKSNQEIYLCPHITTSEFKIFYRVIMSYYFAHEKMTIESFYTILYFLEYLRVQYDDKLRKFLISIFFSLSQSTELEDNVVDKIPLHFSKQEIFSHEFFKIISQEYFEFFKHENNFNPWVFIRENNICLLEKYEIFYTPNRSFLLILKDDFFENISKNIAKHVKSKNLFILVLNTFDIKYLHVLDVKLKNLKICCFILENLQKRLDEIVFHNLRIPSQFIISLNTNQAFIYLKKIVFLESTIITKLKFSKTLNKIDEFIFYDCFIINKENLIAKFEILTTFDKIKDIFDLNKYKNYNYISFLSLFDENIFKEKIKSFKFLDLKYNFWQIGCNIRCNSDFFNISITFYELDLNEFKVKGNVIEKNISEIAIDKSTINCGFLKDILDIYELKNLRIFCSEIFLKENLNFNNKSIEYFTFGAKCDAF
ncbi:hypothetical protein CWI36_0815p0020 [Hamiltosporidium magnivora]|uniref:Uncharacterized protein n=1 Tax=Hamiltosporidium magnivora TaxID=148818 RepID=A0A4Q9L8L0_9MICR|nr:hypothetical protein CWI36_0815p0020 [Hamiltosporidium magnivora]